MLRMVLLFELIYGKEHSEKGRAVVEEIAVPAADGLSGVQNRKGDLDGICVSEHFEYASAPYGRLGGWIQPGIEGRPV